MTHLKNLAHRVIGEVAVLIIWPAVVYSEWRHERRVKTLRATRAHIAAIERESWPR